MNIVSILPILSYLFVRHVNYMLHENERNLLVHPSNLRLKIS